MIKIRSDLIRSVRARDRRRWRLTVGRSAQEGELGCDRRRWGLTVGRPVQGGELDCDRCNGEIGCDPWDGVARLAGHGLGKRETEQRERTEQWSVQGTGVARGWLGEARGGWRGGWWRWGSESREWGSESREKRVRAEHGGGRVFWFWKMVYGNIFRKPFSVFSFSILRSNENIFSLTFVLHCTKRLQMLKTFYEKRFQPKQTEH